VFLLVRAAVLAACAENIHDLRNEAGEHRLSTQHSSVVTTRQMSTPHGVHHIHQTDMYLVDESQWVHHHFICS